MRIGIDTAKTLFCIDGGVRGGLREGRKVDLIVDLQPKMAPEVAGLPLSFSHLNRAQAGGATISFVPLLTF